jgi:hypothetical protein
MQTIYTYSKTVRVGFRSAVECLHSMWEALGLIPSTTKINTQSILFYQGKCCNNLQCILALISSNFI